MENNHNIQIRNEEVQEILGNVPSWIVRWGTSLIVGMLLLFVVGSFIYKSPSVIREVVTITTENPPAKVVARSDGKIESLFVIDKQKVMPEEPLAIIENPANYQHVRQLKMALDTLHKNNFNGSVTASSLDLGEIQPHFETFKKAFDTYLHFNELRYHPQKAKALANELSKLKGLFQQLKDQNVIIYEDLKLLEKQYNRDSILFAEGVISEQAMDQSKANLFQKQLNYHESLSRMSQIELEIAKLEEVRIDNNNDFKQLEKDHFLQLKESYQNLNARINIWENNYVLKAPIAGEVSFTEFWSTNQFVTSGNTVMIVIPEKQGPILGKIKLNQDGAGKVNTGQKVIIKLRNYPYLEYGTIEGQVHTISAAAENDMFSVFVKLPEELTTNYGRTLEFAYDMEGNAEIITKDIRLIDKIINPLKSVLNRNKM